MSTLSLRKLKHDSSSVDNITLDSNGQVGIRATPTAPLTVGRVNSAEEGGQLDLCKASDNSNAWGIDVFGSTSTPSLRIIDNTAAAIRMNIDGSGRVTMPYQPCFYAYGGGFQNTVNSVIQFTTIHTNRGSCYNNSTYRFTAPVAGAYIFHYAAMTDGGGYNRYVIRVNGSATGGTMFASSDAYENFSGHWILQLNANDYVDIFGTADVLIHPDYRTFSGYLIG